MTSAKYLTERAVRNYALHLALMVRRRGSMLALYERYDPKRKIGEYRTWAAVERAIVRYGDEWLRSRGCGGHEGRHHPPGCLGAGRHRPG
jgi:hypothetical protein